MPSLKLTQFGGLIPRQPAHNLPASMAQVAHDVDLSHGTLRPWRTDKKVSDRTGNALFADHCCYLTSENCRASFAKMQTDCDFIVATGVADFPVIARQSEACNGQWQPLGFPLSLPAPNAQFLGTLSENFNQELRQYIYTLVDEFGFESAPSLPSEPLYAHNDEAVIISGIFTRPLAKTLSAVRIYCAVSPLDYGEQVKEGNAEAVFLLVDELPFGTGSYVHQPHTVYGEECLTEEYQPPSEAMCDIQACGNGQIGGLVGSALWLSEPLKPHAFPEAYRYGRFKGKPLRFLASETVGYVLTDSYPAVVQIAEPPQAHGQRAVAILEEPLPLIAGQSACVYNGACFYASQDGIVMLAGAQAKIITCDLFSPDQWQALAPWTMIGTVFDGYYFGFTERQAIRFKVPESIHGEIPLDTLTTLSLRPTAVYRSAQDSLFLALADGIYQWNAGDQWKTFTWRGRLNSLSAYTAMTAYKLVQDYAPAHVQHLAYKRHRSEMVSEPVVLGDKTVIDSRPHRLKAGYATLAMEVEISGQGEVWEYHLATSVAELGAE